MAAAWECPALPMIYLPLKESSKTNFQPLKPLIASRYGENPDSFTDEIKQLEQLRDNCLKPARDHNGCNILRRYYAQLHLLSARFPEDAATMQVHFAWKDAFSSSETKQDGLNIELSSILYNIGAVHSQVGAKDGRHHEVDMKESLTHFQCAAGAFQYFLDNHVSNGSSDISPQLVEMYKNLMLAQAQECTVEKSLKGLSRVKNLNISKLAMKVSQYYQGVLLVLESGAGAAILKKHKDWVKLLQLKSTLYAAIAHLYQASSLEEHGNYGYMIAFQQLSLQKIQSVGKLPRGTPDVFKEAIKNFTEYIQQRLDTSMNQNEQVFHELVPSLETLEPAPGVELVKPIVFQAVDRKTSGTDIFAKLVPMSAYEASSVYSEEKAKILRSVASSVEEKNKELEQFISSLNMEEIDHSKAQNPTLPAELLSQHHLLRSKRLAILSIKDKVQELKELSEKVEEQLTTVAQKKREDEQEERECQDKHGPRPESQVCISMWKELQSLMKYHHQASNSNKELFSAFDKHRDNLLLLAGDKDELVAAIPKRNLREVGQDFNEEKWKELMDKVDEMKTQRSTLTRQLRDQIAEDDITRVIIGELSSNRDALFDEYLHKHRTVADVIRQNLTAQDNILRALTEANAQQAQSRQSYHQLVKRREEWCVSLAKSAGCYGFLENKISEGLEFYSKLAESVFRLYKRCQEVCATRRRDRLSLEKARTTPSPVPLPHPSSSSSASTTPEPRPPNRDTKPQPGNVIPSVDETSDPNEVQKMILKMKEMQEQQKAALNAPPTEDRATPTSVQSDIDAASSLLLVNSNGRDLPAPLVPMENQPSEMSVSIGVTGGQDPIPLGQNPVLPTQDPKPINQNPVIDTTTIPVSNSPIPDSNRLNSIPDSSLSDAINDTAFVSVITSIAQSGGEFPSTDTENRVTTPSTDQQLSSLSATPTNLNDLSLITPPTHPDNSLMVTPPTHPDTSSIIPPTNPDNPSMIIPPTRPDNPSMMTPPIRPDNPSIIPPTRPDNPSIIPPTRPDNPSIPPTRPDKPLHLTSAPVTKDSEDTVSVTGSDAEVATLLDNEGEMEAFTHHTVGIGSKATPTGHDTPTHYQMPISNDSVDVKDAVIPDNVAKLVSETSSNELKPMATDPTSSVSLIPSQLRFIPPPPLSVTTAVKQNLSPVGVAHVTPTLASPQATMPTSSTAQLENMIVTQQRMIQNQSNQLNEQQDQMKAQTNVIQELRNELQLLRNRQNEQDRDKTASSSNQAMLMGLLQQQQGLFTQQQTQLDKMSKEGEARRQQTTELEMKLRDALAQEQFQNQSIQGQIAQQSKEIQHLNQQLHSANQQLQGIQNQAQQYVVQIQERDKALANYREEHKRIVDGMEGQFKQRIQQLTQQVQELQMVIATRGGRGGIPHPQGQGPHPPGPGLQAPLQPQQQYNPQSYASALPAQGNSSPRIGGGLMDTPNPTATQGTAKLQPVQIAQSPVPPVTSGQNPVPSRQTPVPAGQNPTPAGQNPVPSGQNPVPSGQNPIPPRQNPGQNPIPSGQNPIPPGQNPLPTGQNPLPSRQTPVSIAQIPIPTGQNPISPRQNPILTGQNPIQAGQNLIPAGQNPIPTGQNLMPTGQNLEKNQIPVAQNSVSMRQNSVPSQNPGQSPALPVGPLPTRQNPLPVGQNPISPGQNPVSARQNSSQSSGLKPVPTGPNSIPTGQIPTPPRQNPVPGGENNPVFTSHAVPTSGQIGSPYGHVPGQNNPQGDHQQPHSDSRYNYPQPHPTQGHIATPTTGFANPSGPIPTSRPTPIPQAVSAPVPVRPGSHPIGRPGPIPNSQPIHGSNPSTGVNQVWQQPNGGQPRPQLYTTPSQYPQLIQPHPPAPGQYTPNTPPTSRH